MNPRLPSIICLLLFFAATAFAEDKSNAKFGKVGPEDFKVVAPKDSNADAIVIADIGASSFEGNSKGGLSLIFRRFRRVKIITQNGFDAASVKIPLYTSGGAGERVENLKAHTYNIENGAVEETDLDKKSVFTDKLSGHLSVCKFTFPAVKAGSIIEYSYAIHSDFVFNLQPWAFQGPYPCLWSEYSTSIPQFFEYVKRQQGYLPYAISTSEAGTADYSLTDGSEAGANKFFDIRSGVNKSRWVIKNVPAIKEEKFTTTIRNYASRISFQLSAYLWPEKPRQPVLNTWPEATERLLKEEEFGSELGERNEWLGEPLEKIVAGAASPLEKAQRIYAFERDNFTCTRHTALYRERPLQTIFEKRSGNVAELNLLLTAMLRHQGLTADPVILSTRDNGFTATSYPLMSDYNYVVCRAVIDGRNYFMDASRSNLGFGRLATDCYNGYAHIISTALPVAVNLSADSLRETKSTIITITADKKDGAKMTGSYLSQPGYYESAAIREAVKDHGQADFFKKAKATFTMDIDISNPDISRLAQKEEAVTVSYGFSFDKTEGPVLYINPMMGEGIRENYFSAAERRYPVEMPYTGGELYNFDMEIPAGYEVEELPQSAMVSLNDNEGTFSYMASSSGGHIYLSSQIVLNKATFQPEDYENLRSFYASIVKKQAEQIVLKKKS